MKQTFERFYKRIKRGAVTLFFFSGFAIQSDHLTYLIPVDAQIWLEADVRRDGISLDDILNNIAAGGAKIKIALLDASRRNPYERRFRSHSAGLAPANAPVGTLLMYSAALNSVQSDSSNEHGLFVTELLKNVGVPDLTADDALNRTRIAISAATHGEDVPWVSSSMAEDFSLDSDLNRPALTDQPVGRIAIRRYEVR